MNKLFYFVLFVFFVLICLDCFCQEKKYCYDSTEVLKILEKFDRCDFLEEQNKDLRGQNDTLKMYIKDAKDNIKKKDTTIISLRDFINFQDRHIIEIENKPTQTIVEKRPWYEIPVYTTAGITLGILLKILVIK